MISDYNSKNDIEQIETNFSEYIKLKNRLSESEIDRSYRADIRNYTVILFEKIIISISSVLELQIKAAHNLFLGGEKSVYVSNLIKLTYKETYVPYTNNLNSINKNFSYLPEKKLLILFLPTEVKGSITEVVKARHELAHTGKLKRPINNEHIIKAILFLKFFKFQVLLHSHELKGYNKIQQLQNKLKKDTPISEAKSIMKKIDSELRKSILYTSDLDEVNIYGCLNEIDLRKDRETAVSIYKKLFK